MLWYESYVIQHLDAQQSVRLRACKHSAVYSKRSEGVFSCIFLASVYAL